MKYAIYDKAADGYLTKLEFENDVPVQTLGLICGHNEYITEAQLLDTPKEAADAIVRIESFKFMEKGRFVAHSFDEKLADQYIISEAGNPTKVVDNITVDLSGTIDVKYGTMPLHWSTPYLIRAITRLNALQKAASDTYTTWRNTFDIYKVTTVIDERSCTHYQFIKVTEKGLTEYAKNEVDPLNKRIEELENANYDLGEKAAARGRTANRLQEENDDLKTKVEAMKKEARDWKKMYESAVEHREVLKNVIDAIYTDLKSATAYCDKSYRLKATLNAFKRDDALNHISMPTAVYYIQENGVCLTAKDEVCAIIDQILTIMESRELYKKTVYAAEEIPKAIANDIITICEADDKFEVTLKKFSELYETVNDSSNDSNTIVHAFKGVLEIFTALERKVRNVIDKNAAMNKELSDAADALKEVNDKNDALADMLREITNYVADIMLATRTVDRDTMISELVGISNKIGFKTSDDGPMFGVLVILNTLINIAKEGTDWKRRAEEAISDYTRCNGALGEWKRKYKTIREERDKALERAEKFKGIANSVYGITVPGRCCGKQVMADILSGKKIPISKDRYDDLVECVNNINITYDIMKCADFTMNKPLWFDGIINRIKNLTK